MWQINQLAIAAGVVGVTTALFFIAFLANIVGQFHATGTYIVPEDLVNVIKMVFGVATAVLTWGGISGARKQLEKKEDGKAQEGSTDCLPDCSCCPK